MGGVIGSSVLAGISIHWKPTPSSGIPFQVSQACSAGYCVLSWKRTHFWMALKRKHPETKQLLTRLSNSGLHAGRILCCPPRCKLRSLKVRSTAMYVSMPKVPMRTTPSRMVGRCFALISGTAGKTAVASLLMSETAESGRTNLWHKAANKVARNQQPG